jgi:hypothetical protein
VELDFSQVHKGDLTLLEYSKQFSVEDLHVATHVSIDTILDILCDLNDADVIFDPVDPDARDPYAAPGEETIGWNIAHLVAHVTASSEEWAAYSSILARGIVYPAEPRLRYETAWRGILTKSQCVQRLEESRRIRLAYLDAWPDEPHLHVFRQLSERFIERHGPMNAPAAFLYGLQHEAAHHDQLREVARQAKAARETGVGVLPSVRLQP